jgi:hypothetical protein
MIKRLVRV